MKEEDIKAILVRKHIAYAPHGTICATIKASVGAYQNGVGAMMHTRKEHILHINHEGIAIMAMDDIKGTPQEDTLLFLPKEEILSTRLRLRIFTFQLCIQTPKGELSYKIRKNNITASWHKENLAFLLLSAQSQ